MRLKALFVLFILAVISSGCSPPEPETLVITVAPEISYGDETVITTTPEPVNTLAPTQAPQATSTLKAENTTAPTSKPQPTNTPVPQPTDTPKPTDTPTPDPVACLGASYVADVTIPDDSHFANGESFTKIWRVENSGSCGWPEGVVIAFQAGDQMGAPDKVKVENLAQVGQQADISIPMVAPASYGRYTGSWQLRDAGGNLFGDLLTVVIVAGDPPTSVPTPIPTSAPAPVIQPTQAPVAQPTQEPVAQPTQEPQAGITLVSLTSPISKGSNATLTIQVAAGATCDPGVIYKSESGAQGLEAKTAGGDGILSWTWKVGPRTTSGSWTVYVNCNPGGYAQWAFVVQ